MSTPAPRSEKTIRQMLRQRTRRAKISCFPCRTRKVKCNHASPCASCSKRGYPELCTLAEPGESGNRGSPAANHQSSGNTMQKPPTSGFPDEPVYSGSDISARAQDSHSPSSFRDASMDTLSALNAISQRAAGATPESTLQNFEEQEHREPFLGTNSMPAFLKDRASQIGSDPNTPKDTVEEAILPILGLKGQKSTYPFLPDSENSIEKMNWEIYQTLPADHEITGLFQRYMLSAHPFTPIIPDIGEFEAQICQYLEERALFGCQSSFQTQCTVPQGKRTSISWVASLFAILASGVQYTHLSPQERQVKSKIFARSSFQCLRMANFLVHPSLLCVQTFLILGHVLQNDMKPEAAWMQLGTTVRMAQSLGFHEDKNDDPDSPRSKIWKALVWQDSLLSLTFDRPPVTTPSRSNKQVVDGVSYQEAMNLLCDRTLCSIRDKANSSDAPDFVAILEDVYRIEDIHSKSLTKTASKPRSTLQQRTQAFSLSLHISFVVAWLCRPALKSCRGHELRTETQLLLIEKCNMNLLECIRAFVSLYSINNVALRSWPVIHNGLSSALLLGLLGSTNTNSEVRELQHEIIKILSAVTVAEGRKEQDSSGNIQLSAPYVRALAVLRKLYNDRGANSMTPPTFDDRRQDEVRLPQQTLSADTQFQRDQSDSNMSNIMDMPALDPSFDPSLLEMSPLDMFNTIIWDPMNVEDPAPDYNLPAFEPWNF